VHEGLNPNYFPILLHLLSPFLRNICPLTIMSDSAGSDEYHASYSDQTITNHSRYPLSHPEFKTPATAPSTMSETVGHPSRPGVPLRRYNAINAHTGHEDTRSDTSRGFRRRISQTRYVSVAVVPLPKPIKTHVSFILNISPPRLSMVEYCGEFFGTMILVVFGCGANCQVNLGNDKSISPGISAGVTLLASLK